MNETLTTTRQQSDYFAYLSAAQASPFGNGHVGTLAANLLSPAAGSEILHDDDPSMGTLC
jgi:hypothetical protein